MKKIFENKIFKAFLNLLEFFLFLIICTYLVFVIIQRIGNNKSLFGYRVFTVATSSMEPVYNVNDVLIVKDVDPNTLKVNDDIAYLGTRGGLEGKIITHRIIKIESSATQKIFYTQGVNNDNADPSIKSNQILGIINGKLPIINELNHLVKNQYGFFFLVFCPLVLVIALEIIETIIRIKIDKEEIVSIKEEKNTSSSENNAIIEEKESDSENTKEDTNDEEIL